VRTGVWWGESEGRSRTERAGSGPGVTNFLGPTARANWKDEK